jgi:hypothetical protein
MANQVIFSGAPSQVCNLPAILKGCAVMTVIGAIHVCTSNAFPLQWHVLLAQAGAVLIGVGVPFVKTAFTRIVIDTEQITWTQGILHRRVSSLKLSRIQGTTSIHPWWRRWFDHPDDHRSGSSRTASAWHQGRGPAPQEDRRGGSDASEAVYFRKHA